MKQDSPFEPQDEFDARMLASLDALGREARRCSPDALARIARISAASLPLAQARHSSSGGASVGASPERRRSHEFARRFTLSTSFARYALAAALVGVAALATAFVMLREGEKPRAFEPSRELAIETPRDSSSAPEPALRVGAILPAHLESALAREVAVADGLARSNTAEAALLRISCEACESSPSADPFGVVLASRAVHFDEFEAELRVLAGERSSF